MLLNEYFKKINDDDCHIYSIDEFNDVCSKYTPLELIYNCMFDDNFGANAEWFYFDEHKNIRFINEWSSIFKDFEKYIYKMSITQQ